MMLPSNAPIYLEYFKDLALWAGIKCRYLIYEVDFLCYGFNISAGHTVKRKDYIANA